MELQVSLKLSVMDNQCNPIALKKAKIVQYSLKSLKNVK